MQHDKSIIQAEVFRHDPDRMEDDNMELFEIETEGPLSIMTLLGRIHQQDPSFACRTSMCFHGTCGSCLVNVNGKNVKGCMAMVQPGERVVIRPHSGFKVLRDVVVDFDAPLAKSTRGDCDDRI